MKQNNFGDEPMSYPNPFLRNFRPVFFAILKEKSLSLKRVELEVIDEEAEDYSAFEPADVRDVLEQLSEDLNFLTIYTERPAYFKEFAETMYVDNGLHFRICAEGCKFKNNPNVYYASHKLELGHGNMIPLWLFGFLY